MPTMTAAIVRFAAFLAASVCVSWPGCALAQQPASPVGSDIGTLYPDQIAPLYKAPGYSPYAGRTYPTRVLWGDTHLHTANLQIPVHRGQSFRRIADSVPVIADSFR
jgi:hypothetical protein